MNRRQLVQQHPIHPEVPDGLAEFFKINWLGNKAVRAEIVHLIPIPLQP